MMKLSRLVAYQYCKLACSFSGYPLPSYSEFKKVEIVLLSDDEMKEKVAELEAEFNYSLDGDSPAGFVQDWLDGHMTLFIWDHYADGWNPDTCIDHAHGVLIHELVHYLQHTNDVNMKDTKRIETEAYTAQRKYMQQVGYDSLPEDTEKWLKEIGYVD